MANCWGNCDINDFNCNEICRLCLTREGEMSPIFSRPSDVKSISIPYRIMAFTSIKLETGDGLPGLICHSCLFNVERVYEFKQQCEQSDAFLRKYFSLKNYQDIKIENENVKSTNTNFNSNGNNIFQQSKFDEDNEGVVKSPLKQGSIDKDGIESVVMVVDPNAKTLDASISDNDNDNQIENDIDSEFSRKIDDVNLESTGNNWFGNPPISVANQNTKEHKVNLYPCPSCNKPFVDQHLLERHKMIHTQEPFFPCDFCELVFNDRAALKSHWRDHAGLSKLSCMTCGESFTERSDLVEHITIHDVMKPYHCIICNRAFSNRSDLRKHLIIHTGARPFICEVCGKSFTRSTNLNKHARAHAGNRPYACTECPKKFSTRADLTRHTVTHTGEKPYSCSVCGLAFSRRDKLTRHIKLHEKNNRPFFCEECALSFNNRKVLASHYQIHHKNLDLPKEVRNSKEFRDYFESNPKTSNLSIMHKLLTAGKSSTDNGDSEDVVINVDPFPLNNSSPDVDIFENS